MPRNIASRAEQGELTRFSEIRSDLFENVHFMIVVTSCDSPDLDGIACSIAYTELLIKLGKEAKTTYYGDLGLEIEFVRKFTKYFPVIKHNGKYNTNTQFVLVDTADPDMIEPTISLAKVIEIYDHRQLVFVEKFVNSNNKIELVGSCATLITEEFQKNKLKPSKNSAIYLYSAIISNTIIFKNTITTKRDKRAALWLQKFFTLPPHYIEKMFSSKSSIKKNNLYDVLFQDFAVKVIGSIRVGIAQIEVVDLQKKLKLMRDELVNALDRLKKANILDYIFFSGVDVYEGYNIFFTIDPVSNELFSKVLGISKLHPGYRSDKIIMRKQIWPMLEKVLTHKFIAAKFNSNDS